MQNPWRCLAAYKEPQYGDKETYLFCGRDRETYELASLVKNNLYVTLYGRTGIGKTSLLEAGVFPQLRREGYVPVVVRFDLLGNSEKTFAELVVQSIENQDLVIEETNNNGTILSVIDGKPNVEYLWEYFATRHFYDGEREVFPMIVLDQFEENLIANRDKSESLLKQIYALIDDNKEFPEGYHSETNFRFVISIREDELFRLEECIDRNHLLDFKKNRYRLTHLSKQDAEEVICMPGGNLLPDNKEERHTIIDRILNQATDEDSDNINTLLLSLVCSCLYERCIVRNADRFTVSDIDALGDNLLIDFYESLHIKKKIREVIENKFIDTKGRRNVVNIVDLNIPQSELDELCTGNKRILQRMNKRMELIHDLLAYAIFETKQKRQKKSLRRILKIYLLVLFLIVLITGLFGSVFSFSDSNVVDRNPIFPQKELILSRGEKCEIENNYYIETIICEGKTNDIYVRNCNKLKRFVLQGDARDITIENCPSLRYLVFSDSLRIRRVNLFKCPNLRSLNIPNEVQEISSDIKISVIPNAGNTKYITNGGIVWDIKTPKIIYANLYPSDINHTDSAYVVFPRQLQYRSEIQYDAIDRIVSIYNNSEITKDGFITAKYDSTTVISYVRGKKYFDLSGLKISDGAFENCNDLEYVTINSKTLLGNHIFSNCPNLKQITICQSPDLSLMAINSLLISIRTIPFPLTYELIGEGPLKKNKEGIVMYNDIPVLISKESSKEYESKMSGNITYVCTKGWRCEFKSKGLSAYGQPQITALPETLQPYGHNIIHRFSNCLIVNRAAVYLEDSFTEGSVYGFVFCRNLTKKDRTFYIKIGDF